MQFRYFGFSGFIFAAFLPKNLGNNRFSTIVEPIKGNKVDF